MNPADDLLLSHARVDGDVSPAAVEDAAWAFVSAGGVLTLSEYRGLSTSSRGAIRRAQSRLWAERFAGAIGALKGGMEALEASSGDDAAQKTAERLAGSVLEGLDR